MDRSSDTAEPNTWPDTDAMVRNDPTKAYRIVLIHPDGSVETLVDFGPNMFVSGKPMVSFDGENLLFSATTNKTPHRFGNNYPTAGYDIYELQGIYSSRTLRRLTFGSYEPDSPMPALDPVTNQPGGELMLNLGATYVPTNDGDDIIFASSRTLQAPVSAQNVDPKVNFQLFRMDNRGHNVSPIDKMDTGSAIDPQIRKNGWIMYSSFQGQGLRTSTSWCLWTMLPDGRGFGPLWSGFRWGDSYHFATELTDGSLVSTVYYNGNNYGFGKLLKFAGDPDPSIPGFGPADPKQNQMIADGWRGPGQNDLWWIQMPFTPQRSVNLISSQWSDDYPSRKLPDGQYAGKSTHPSGAPDNKLLFVYSPFGTNKETKQVQGQIRLMDGSTPILDARTTTVIKNDADHNYLFPSAVVSYRRIYGVDRPKIHPYLPAAGSPYGLVGTASMINRDTTPGTGRTVFTGQKMTATGAVNLGESLAWNTQGSEAGAYTNDDIYAVRVIAMDPAAPAHHGISQPTFTGQSRDERLRIIGEMVVRKPDGTPLDGDGNPDTSWLAQIPADVPFTFQTLDRDGLMINMAQTWHQVRPGENRHDCGGCHAHAHMATDFSKTAAGRAGYQPTDMVNYLHLLAKDGSGNMTTVHYPRNQAQPYRTYEFNRDIRPILDRACVSCHSGAGPAANLNLANIGNQNFYERTYYCLSTVRDWESAQCTFDGRKYIIPFQARRSPLVWKVMGARKDGLTNATFSDDYDYSAGTVNHANLLNSNEILTLTRWIELGALSGTNDSRYQNSTAHADDSGPTLEILAPRAGRNKTFDKIVIGAIDYLNEIDKTRTSIKASFTVNGKPAGTELASFFQDSGNDTLTLNLSQPITSMGDGVITVSVADASANNNVSALRRTFSVDPNAETPVPTSTPLPRQTFATATPTPTSTSTPVIVGKATVTPIPPPGTPTRRPTATFTPTPTGPTPTPISGAPVIKMRLNKKATAGQPILWPIIASNKPTQYGIFGKLPRGLRLNRKTGHLTGAVKLPGTYIFDVWAKNSKGKSGNKTLTLKITKKKKR